MLFNLFFSYCIVVFTLFFQIIYEQVFHEISSHSQSWLRRIHWLLPKANPQLLITSLLAEKGNLVKSLNSMQWKRFRIAWEMGRVSGNFYVPPWPAQPSGNLWGWLVTVVFLLSDSFTFRVLFSRSANLKVRCPVWWLWKSLPASSPSEGFTSSHARLSRTRKKTRVRGSLILNSLGWSMSFPLLPPPLAFPGNSRRTLETKLRLDEGVRLCKRLCVVGSGRGWGCGGKKMMTQEYLGFEKRHFQWCY